LINERKEFAMTVLRRYARGNVALAGLGLLAGVLAVCWTAETASAADRVVLGEGFVDTG
jgi:hypothetical protein